MTRDDDARIGGTDVSAGGGGPTRSFEALHRRDFVQYAGASGDFNPIHYDEPFATRAGNPSVFAPGMLTAGLAATYVSEWFGLERVRVFDVRFQAKVWPGDSLTASGRILTVDPSSKSTRVDAEVSIENQRGETVLTGTVEAELPRSA